jgi:hypothetical protein
MKCSGPKGGVIRHSHLTPLVNRLVHSASGTSRIAADPTFERVSNDEYSRLRERFGYVPW